MQMQNTRWRNDRGFEMCDSPEVAYAALMLSYAICDYATFGWKRHRQRCRTGRDWVRDFGEKAEGKGHGGVSKGKDYIPPIYRDLHQKVEWLYSLQFGLLIDVLDCDLEQARAYYLRLLAGPPDVV